MASVKIILRTSKTNSAGEAPICIRLIKNRKAKFIFLDYRIKPTFWDEKNKKVKMSHPNASALNKHIAAKVLEAEGVAIDLETTNKYILPEQIKNQIMGRCPESFFKYADRYIEELEYKELIATHRKVKAIIGKLKEYTEGKDLLLIISL